MKEPKYSSKIECSELISFAQKYSTAEDKHSRYHSWEHCYSFFKKGNRIHPKYKKNFCTYTLLGSITQHLQGEIKIY